MTTQRAKRWLLVSLGLIAAGGFGSYLVQTAGGRIEVVGLKIPAENGQWITADLFRPKTATAKTPAPLVIVCPGFERSKETMDGYSLELARRGMVVITIDPYSQGASSSTLQRRSTTVEGNGVVPVVEYVFDTPNLNYIDRARIGAAGYSAGGNAVLQSAARLGARPPAGSKPGKRRNASGDQAPVGTAGLPPRPPSKLFAVFVGGYVLTLTDDVLRTLDSNVAIDYAYYDEGAYRTESGHAHLEAAPEALRLVNAVVQPNRLTAITIGKAYGSAANRTLRIVYNTHSIHPLMPYAPGHIAKMVDYFTTVFGLKPAQIPTNQVWPLKEVCTLLALVGALLFLVPGTALLLTLPCFRRLNQPLPAALPAPSRTGKALFWSLFIVSALAACFLFIPLARATAVLFPAASDRMMTWWFPQRINNAILLWAVANGLIGLLLFFLNYRLFGRKHGVAPSMWGLKTSPGELATTAGLALTVFAAFYVLLFATYGVFHSDFRFIFISAAASFPAKMPLLALEYVPLFFVFYFGNSVRVNCVNRFEGQREWAGMLIGALGNSVGLMLLLAIQYSCLISTGKVYWTDEWIYVNLLLGVIPMMFVLPYFHRYFFRLTGKVYLGPMITCLVFIMMMLTSNVCYLPLE